MDHSDFLPDVDAFDVSALFALDSFEPQPFTQQADLFCAQDWNIGPGYHSDLSVIPNASGPLSILPAQHSTQSFFGNMELPTSNVVPWGFDFSSTNSQFQIGSLWHQHNTKRGVSDLQHEPRKRARKAPTMSEQKWEPALDRIRQLYVIEEKKILEVRDIINEEFSFDAK